MSAHSEPPALSARFLQPDGRERDGGDVSVDGGRASAPLTVTLTHEELLLAAFHAITRSINRTFTHSGDRLRNRWLEDGLASGIIGAIGEMGVAKALNVFFPAGFKQTDAYFYEVRATTRKDGSLIVRENDSSAKTYVLALVEPPKVIIAGCIYGADAKQKRFWRAPNGRPGAYFVPQRALKPLLLQTFRQTIL
jgi:hypothetical protein